MSDIIIIEKSLFVSVIVAHSSDITQIAASTKDSTFNKYIMPVKSIEPGASKVTNLTTRGGKLLYKGKEVQSYEVKDALKDFLSFLQLSSQPILVGHNCRSFDVPCCLDTL